MRMHENDKRRVTNRTTLTHVMVNPFVGSMDNVIQYNVIQNNMKKKTKIQ